MGEKHTATPWKAEHVEFGGVETDEFCIVSLAECREVVTIDRCYSNGERDPAKEKAVAEFIVRACNAHDDLVKALQRAKTWIEGQMEDHGWSIDRVKNPPEGSHLHAINAALSKAGA